MSQSHFRSAVASAVAVATALAILPSCVFATNEIIAERFESFTGFPAATPDGTTSPSSISGNDFLLVGSPNAGLDVFTGSVDGGNGFRVQDTEVTAGFVYSNLYNTLFTTGNATHQLAFLAMADNPSGVPVANGHSEFLSTFFGDATVPGVSFAVGSDATPADAVKVCRISSTTTLSGTCTAVTGVPAGTWTAVVMQYDLGAAATFTAGFHCWFDPVTSADAPLFSRGSQVTGGSGTVALGPASGTTARPPGGVRLPGDTGFGDWLFANTSPTYRANCDCVGLWNEVADITTADTARLQDAINWIAACRLAKNADWNLY